MGQFVENFQYRIKNSSTSFAVLLFRMAVGAFLGLTFALIGQQTIGYGGFAFAFVIVTVTMMFLKISSVWRSGSVLVFALVCVLIGLLLRMYIMVAPGA